MALEIFVKRVITCVVCFWQPCIMRMRRYKRNKTAQNLEKPYYALQFYTEVVRKKKNPENKNTSF